MGGKPSGSRSTAPKSSTPRRPSASRRKLPGCGSACRSLTRAGQRLPELNRAALEFAKDPEDLICCPLLDFLGHQLSWPAAQAFAGSQCGPAREPDRQPSQSGRAGASMARQIADDPILRYAGLMHRSDRMHRSNRQLHRARCLARPYRTGAPSPPPPGVSITNRSPAATGIESHPRMGASTAGTALGRCHGCVSTQ